MAMPEESKAPSITIQELIDRFTVDASKFMEWCHILNAYSLLPNIIQPDPNSA